MSEPVVHRFGALLHHNLTVTADHSSPQPPIRSQDIAVTLDKIDVNVFSDIKLHNNSY